MDSVGGQEDAAYMFTNVDVTPFDIGAASCTKHQLIVSKKRLCGYTMNVKTLARFAAVIILY